MVPLLFDHYHGDHVCKLLSWFPCLLMTIIATLFVECRWLAWWTCLLVTIKVTFFVGDYKVNLVCWWLSWRPCWLISLRPCWQMTIMATLFVDDYYGDHVCWWLSRQSFNPITGNVWKCLKSAGGEGQFAPRPPLVSGMFFEKGG